MKICILATLLCVGVPSATVLAAEADTEAFNDERGGMAAARHTADWGRCHTLAGPSISHGAAFGLDHDGSSAFSIDTAIQLGDGRTIGSGFHLSMDAGSDSWAEEWAISEGPGRVVRVGGMARPGGAATLSQGTGWRWRGGTRAANFPVP